MQQGMVRIVANHALLISTGALPEDSVFLYSYGTNSSGTTLDENSTGERIT